MKKSLFVAAIAALAVVACKKSETVETPAADSAAAVVDSAATVTADAATTAVEGAADAATNAADAATDAAKEVK